MQLDDGENLPSLPADLDSNTQISGVKTATASSPGGAIVLLVILSFVAMVTVSSSYKHLQ